MMPKLLGRDDAAHSRPDVVATVRAADRVQQRRAASRAPCSACAIGPTPRRSCRAISVPTLVIVGEEDGITPVDDSRALATAHSRARRLSVLPGAGHLSNLETPDAFNGGGAGLAAVHAPGRAGLSYTASVAWISVFTDKVALITGSSRGLGLASAKALAAEGCRVMLTARGAEQLARAADEVVARRPAPTPCASVAADLSTADGVARAVEATVATFGGLDILVNNMGLAPRRRTARHQRRRLAGGVRPDARIRRFARSRLAVPHMRKRGGGVIVMITSIWGRESGGRMTYNAVKAAETSLAKSLAQQLAPRQHPRRRASRRDRSCSPAGRGTSASRPIRTASPSSSAAICRSAASAAPRKSATSSRFSRRRARAG